MILVDAGVLIDILTHDPTWYAWSKASLEAGVTTGLLINDIVYAELASRYLSEKALDDAVSDFNLSFERVPKSALYAAGRAFQVYRERRGARSNLLPDFFIGAHAATASIPILTRDVRRYQAYFSDVVLIAP